MKILLIDNNDSFTFNIVEMLRQIAKSTSIEDKININICPVYEFTLSDAADADKVIISPGPGLPEDYPALFDMLKEFAERKSILGICMGHQVICRYFGGRLFNLPQVVHGQPKQIQRIHPTSVLFHGIQTMKAGLYHSWAVVKDSLPEELKVVAISDDDVVMAVEHTNFDIQSVQFHPESYMTENGKQIFANFLLSASRQ